MWELPDLFEMEDGSRLSSSDQLIRQQERMRCILQEQLYGHMPPAPTQMNVELVRSQLFHNDKALFEQYNLIFGTSNNLIMPIYVMRPNCNKKTIPIVLAGGFIAEECAELAVMQNMAVITFDSSLICPDESEYTEFLLYKEYPEYDWKVIAMWAWLQSRCIDWVEKQEYFETDKIVVAGHSRFGKSSICCAIYDERVKTCAAAGSGCGGMGSLRIAGGREGKNTLFCETLGTLTERFPQWFQESLKMYGSLEMNGHNKENELLFDANWLGACIAPRNLLILEGLDDSWANPYGTFQTWKSLSIFYDQIGVRDACAIHFREGGHAFHYIDWLVLTDFINVRERNAEKKTLYRTDIPTEDFHLMMKRAYGSFKKPDRWLFK